MDERRHGYGDSRQHSNKNQSQIHDGTDATSIHCYTLSCSVEYDQFREPNPGQPLLYQKPTVSASNLRELGKIY